MTDRLAAAVREWIAGALGLAATVREARAAAAAADAAARRAEGAAASAVAAARVPLAHDTMSVHARAGHDKMSGRMTKSHDKMAGPDKMAGGAPGRPWRELDSDIETLD